MRLAILVVLDTFILTLGYWASYALRLESFDFEEFSGVFWQTLPIGARSRKALLDFPEPACGFTMPFPKKTSRVWVLS